MTSVNLYNVIAAAKHDPTAAQGSALHKADVLPVEQALAQEGWLRQEWVDGSYGTKTVEAYSAYQSSLGYTGDNADGIPGFDSLTKLGKKRGFVVSTGGNPNPPPATGGAIPISAVQYHRFSPGATSSVAAAVTAICKLTGRADNGWTAGYEVACLRESSRNPSSINDYDSNAWGPTVGDGFPLHCSRGIAQCIPDTFASNHQAGTSDNIYDTIANIAASMNYVIHRYGVHADGSNLASRVQQFDPNRSPAGY